MNNTRTHARALAPTRACLLAIAALLCLIADAAPARDKEKMKPEDVLAKHLESIGTNEARGKVRNLVVGGTATLNVRLGGKGQTTGASLIASEGRMSLLKMVFQESPSYPFELLSYDGKNFGAVPLRPGVRSSFSEFLLENEMIFKEGLMGGALTTAWPLLSLTERGARLDYQGTKKIGERQAHELRYKPRGGSDMKVTLFFDAETFRHLRTEYERTLAAALGGRISTSGASAGKNEIRYKMSEDFSDFKSEGGLMLPHAYRLHLSVQGPVPVLMDFVFDLTQFTFNQQLNPKDFTPQS